jgi:large subunit ribosomal protein L10
MKSQKSHLTHVSEKKKGIVSELENLIKTKKTILLASIKSIPSSQYQEIVKRLRGKAVVKVPKKGLMIRAIDNSESGDVKRLKEQIKESTAILFSDLDSFDLAAELISKKSPAKAKPGQEAPSDIEVPAGPTDLVPGPAISELGALGIPIQIEKGKITIKEAKVIAKAGEKISKAAAEMMSKLGIKPFSIGFIPIAAFDSAEGKVYFNINIDREATISELKDSFSKASGFAVNIAYTSPDTITFLIQKAGRQEMTLEKLGGKTEEEVVEEPKAEETTEEIEEKTEENQTQDKLNEIQEENK